MHIQRLTLTPEQLGSLPVEERALLHVLAHALNEVNVVLKLFLLATNYDFEPLVVRHAQLCQTMVLSKVLTGKVYEAWNVVTEGYLKTTLASRFNSALDAATTEALAKLKKYFGPKNTINTVRNKFAFHYSIAHAGKPPDLDTPHSELAIYFGPTVGTSLYQFAEQAMGMAMLDAIDPSNAQGAYDKLLVDTQMIAGLLNNLGQGLMFAILQKHIAVSTKHEELESIDIGPVPKHSDLKIPFFFEVDRANAPGEA